MTKSPDAFRTISEVAEWLGVEAHVLRFWETKFPQVKPVKRAGGRRYYRPSDMALLGGIRRLLHEDGLTIRGVQKLLREQGVGHVASLSPEVTVNGAEPSAPKRRRRPAEGEALATTEEGAGRNGKSEAEPEAPPVHDDAPTLPFDLPPAPLPAPVAGPEKGAERPAPSDSRGSAISAAVRAGRPRLDPAAAAPILARARELARRLRDTPE